MNNVNAIGTVSEGSIELEGGSCREAYSAIALLYGPLWYFVTIAVSLRGCENVNKRCHVTRIW